ncbi:hypothetical protein GOV10_03550 [Candidatus Woesearchaeota archaeon]|nr:hypothetical protein [Candidatus Woesearchaeota archaeon]
MTKKMIYTYAYKIDETHTPQGLIDIAQKYRMHCNIETRKYPRWFFVQFTGKKLDDIADLFDKEADDAGYEVGMFIEEYL